ncbi:copper resistance protein B [Rhodanobacter aciditrophus]|uniref:copper resistance protein B n=1 Tax=Rhodanobacter aciditrophus TaxID=1623218 RepID=UPI003CF68042
MSRHRSTTITALRHSLWLAAGLLLAPAVAAVQTTPATASSSATTDMSSMPGMDMSRSGMSMPAASASVPMLAAAAKARKRRRKPSAKPVHHMPATSHGATAPMGTMPGMSHDTMPEAPPVRPAATANTEGVSPHAMPGMRPEAMQDMDHAAMPAAGRASHAQGAMAGMPMGPMQGGSAPPGARSPDYSDGIGYGAMPGMDMRDAAPLGMLRFDQLEAFHGNDGNGQAWELQGWYGNDSDKLWVRSEGERSRRRIEDGDAELLWSHAVATFWDTQLGLRQDLGEGPARDWAAFGIQGLAPYWFELEATAYLGPSGRTAARLRAEYELPFTQRLILQPEFEVNAYGRSDPARHLGSGVSDARFGLRLRYEVRRQFAPYLGVVWVRRFGGTAGFARDHHQSIFGRQWVAGLRIWF